MSNLLQGAGAGLQVRGRGQHGWAWSSRGQAPPEGAGAPAAAAAGKWAGRRDGRGGGQACGRGGLGGWEDPGTEEGGRRPGPAPGLLPSGFRWPWLPRRLWRRWPPGGRKMATAAAGALGLLWGWLWSERFWLPQNVSWADLEGPADGYGYPRARHMLSVFPLAAGVFSVRLLFER